MLLKFQCHQIAALREFGTFFLKGTPHIFLIKVSFTLESTTETLKTVV